MKLSLLSFYHRIFGITKSGLYSLVIYAVELVVALWTVAYFFAVLFACNRNFVAWWGLSQEREASCIQINTMMLSLLITDAATDVLIIVLPLPMVCRAFLFLFALVRLTLMQIWRLQLSTGRKIALSLVFAIGAVSVSNCLAYISWY